MADTFVAMRSGKGTGRFTSNSPSESPWTPNALSRSAMNLTSTEYNPITHERS
jgi:hypothetical protein